MSNLPVGIPIAFLKPKVSGYRSNWQMFATDWQSYELRPKFEAVQNRAGKLSCPHHA